MIVSTCDGKVGCFVVSSFVSLSSSLSSLNVSSSKRTSSLFRRLLGVLSVGFESADVKVRYQQISQ